MPRLFRPLAQLVLGLIVATMIGQDRIGAATEDNGIPPGYMIIEGDIVVPTNFFDPEAAYQTNLWTNQLVPYQFDANVTQNDQSRMVAAMQQWENVANVTFQQCSQNQCQGNFLHIRDSNGDQTPRNNSQVGMVGGMQTVNITSWNTRFVIVHELGHALGYWHEQQRADRNQVIRVHQQNIDAGECDGACFTANFNPGAPNNYGPYDLDSVMHYGECDFAASMLCPCGNPSTCQTIEVLMTCDTQSGLCQNGARAGSPCATNADCDPRRVGVCDAATSTCTLGRTGQACTNNADCDIRLGQRNHLSRFDGLTMSFLYRQANWRFVNASYTGSQSGTFVQPFRTFPTGVINTPDAGTVWIQPGTYLAIGTYSRPMTIQAPLGGVTLQ